MYLTVLYACVTRTGKLSLYWTTGGGITRDQIRREVNKKIGRTQEPRRLLGKREDPLFFPAAFFQTRFDGSFEPLYGVFIQFQWLKAR